MQARDDVAEIKRARLRDAIEGVRRRCSRQSDPTGEQRRDRRPVRRPVRHLELTEIARADLKSIHRYAERTWGSDRTAEYMAALRDTMKGLLAGTSSAATGTTSVLGSRWPRAAITACSSRSTSHASSSSVCSTTEWTTSVTSKLTRGLVGTGESQAARLSSSTARNQRTTRFQVAKFRLTSSNS